MASLVSREAIRLYESAGPRAGDFFEGNVDEKMQSHPLIQKLHLESAPLQRTFEHLAQKAPELLANAVSAASRETLELITTLSITFLTMLYFFPDGPFLLAKSKYFSPLGDDYEDELVHRFLSVSRATLKGTLLISLLKGTLGGLTLWAFGIEAPVLWGAVMVFPSMLPLSVLGW